MLSLLLSYIIIIKSYLCSDIHTGTCAMTYCVLNADRAQVTTLSTTLCQSLRCIRTKFSGFVDILKVNKSP